MISLVVVAAAGEQPARQPQPAREDAEEAMQDVVCHGCCVGVEKHRTGRPKAGTSHWANAGCDFITPFLHRIAVIFVGLAPIN